ncbi:hypothetical protein D3C75_604120 [compost metagenome]
MADTRNFDRQAEKEPHIVTSCVCQGIQLRVFTQVYQAPSDALATHQREMT